MDSVDKLFHTYDTDGKLTLSARMRIRRFKVVNDLIDRTIAAHGRCDILDIGGSDYYWNLDRAYLDARRDRIHITITNIEDVPIPPSADGLLHYTYGDATKKELYEGPYNMVHSNSVIEHVGGWGNIRAMANNIAQSGLSYYVQTPNYWFPMEPHFRTLGFHWLPAATRAQMLLKKRRGFTKVDTLDDAMREVEAINMLTERQFRDLFPNAHIIREKFALLTKSFMAVHVQGR